MALQSRVARGGVGWRIKATNAISPPHFLFAFLSSHRHCISGGKKGRCAPNWTGSLCGLSVHHVPSPMLCPETGMPLSLPSSMNILTLFQSPDQMPPLRRSFLWMTAIVFAYLSPIAHCSNNKTSVSLWRINISDQCLGFPMRQKPLFSSGGVCMIWPICLFHPLVVIGSDVGTWIKLVQVKDNTEILAEVTGRRLMRFTGTAKLFGYNPKAPGDHLSYNMGRTASESRQQRKVEPSDGNTEVPEDRIWISRARPSWLCFHLFWEPFKIYGCFNYLNQYISF